MTTLSTNDNNFQFEYNETYLRHLGNNKGEYGMHYYSQMNATTLFTIEETGDYIHVYNLNALSFRRMDNIKSIPNTVGDAACLASSEVPSPRLYITGGVHWDNDSQKHWDHTAPFQYFQILALDDYTWTNESEMYYGRYSHGCVVVEDTLWVMGTVPRIETFDVTNIENGEWTVQTEFQLDDRLIDIGVVAVSHYIYVVGGWIGDYDSGGGHNSADVYRIDTKSKSISTETLPYAVSALAMIAVDDTIYGFGGLKAAGTWDSGTMRNSWITYEQFG